MRMCNVEMQSVYFMLLIDRELDLSRFLIYASRDLSWSKIASTCKQKELKDGMHIDAIKMRNKKKK